MSLEEVRALLEEEEDAGRDVRRLRVGWAVPHAWRQEIGARRLFTAGTTEQTIWGVPWVVDRALAPDAVVVEAS